MPLASGTRLGPYEIVSALGAGEMGEVYRATDSNLKRSVAIKVLPASVAGDADRLARFQREAEVLAALNHPNIAAIYGLERTPDVTALVMELVEGEDLSEIIARHGHSAPAAAAPSESASRGAAARGCGAPRAMNIDDALPVARQIAEALEAAHEQGIIHRDLKPANIKVRSDGTVKVLDFGLAKALDSTEASAASAMQSPTLTARATHMGVILGTAAYMAPEQAKGKSVDRRADIWAFGVVLHEMLTGRRLFEAEDISETLAAVLTRDVTVTSLPANIPPRLRALVRDCLVRDPKQRLRDIGDARLVLDRIIANAPDVAAGPPAAAAVIAPTWRRALPWTVAGALGVVALALWAPWRAEAPVDRPLARLTVDLGAAVSLPAVAVGGMGGGVGISPDGTRLVYASGTPAKLFTRRLDQLDATELPGTKGAVSPFFSPDGQWVGFFVGGKVSKIAIDGGAVIPLADVGGLTAGASWSEDSSMVVSVAAKGLVRIPAGGGAPEPVVRTSQGESVLACPQVLPGGKAILLAAAAAMDLDQWTIEVLTLADGHRKILARGGQCPRYLPTSNGTGHVVYLNKATLLAVPFDLDSLEARGTPVPVLNDVSYHPVTNAGHWSVSRTGTLVYRKTGGGLAMSTIQWVDPSGKREPLWPKPDAYQYPSVSPDGSRIAVGVAGSVWIYDLRRDVPTRLTFGGTADTGPRWSPNGRYVVFATPGTGILQARADGASPPQPLLPPRPQRYPMSFTPDGKRLAFFEYSPKGQIWTVPLEDQGAQLKAGTPEPFLTSSSSDVLPSFSPDGRWLAYSSDESGTSEVYVREFRPASSAPGPKVQISNSGGRKPEWSGTAHDLMYQSGDQIMAASYRVDGDTFVPEKPRVWIPKLGGIDWDLAPDGKRVVVLTPMESAAPAPDHEVVFLLNFFDELRRRVPAKK